MVDETEVIEPSGASAEEWRVVPGFDHYQVSSLGRVRVGYRIYVARDGRRMGKRARIKRFGNRRGYASVTLFQDGRKVCWAVHRLVATCFLANPDSLREVNHLNFDRKDNRVENLEWSSHRDNQRHASADGRFDPVVNPKRATKLTPEIVARMRQEIAEGATCAAVALKYGVVRSIAHRISTGQIWKSADARFVRLVGQGRKPKLDAISVAAIRNARSGPTALAREYGVAVSTIVCVRNGTMYKWVN